MSSLAMTAQSIENSDYSNNHIINRKRQTNNKTQKRTPTSFSDIDHSKVQNVLNSIHRNLIDDNGENLGDYKPGAISAPVNASYTPINPLAPPASMRQKQEQDQGQKEGMTNYDYNADDVDNYSSKYVPQPTQNDGTDLQDLQSVHMNNEQVKRYFKNMLPSFQPQNLRDPNITQNQNQNQNRDHIQPPNYQPHNYNQSSDTNQVLLEKLNYMINLLEEQQDERTNNVTEEVILYSFLGIFIIFVVDGFARVTRYTR
uniref:Uncharacterized protein n=1 Tax=viral metagenome TaxID=1070528 RepID=A0A6C0I8T1_9ZZZZ